MRDFRLPVQDPFTAGKMVLLPQNLFPPPKYSFGRHTDLNSGSTISSAVKRVRNIETIHRLVYSSRTSLASLSLYDTFHDAVPRVFLDYKSLSPIR